MQKFAQCYDKVIIQSIIYMGSLCSYAECSKGFNLNPVFLLKTYYMNIT